MPFFQFADKNEKCYSSEPHNNRKCDQQIFWQIIPRESIRPIEFALKNFWARGFIFLNGFISLVVFLIVSPIESLQFAVRPVNNSYLGALIIGISWQAVLRSKVFVIRTSAGKEISLGIEAFWNRLAAIFKTRIAEYEEVNLIAFIQPYLQRYSNLTEAVAVIQTYLNTSQMPVEVKAELTAIMKNATTLNEVFVLFIRQRGANVFKNLFPID